LVAFIAQNINAVEAINGIFQVSYDGQIKVVVINAEVKINIS